MRIFSAYLQQSNGEISLIIRDRNIKKLNKKWINYIQKKYNISKIYYMRSWIEERDNLGEVVVYDFGSWSNFILIKEEVI